MKRFAVRDLSWIPGSGLMASCGVLVWLGLLGPQLEELDRGYEELERRRKEAEQRDRTLSRERDELEGRYKELVDRERAVKVGAADSSRVACVCVSGGYTLRGLGVDE